MARGTTFTRTDGSAKTVDLTADDSEPSPAWDLVRRKLAAFHATYIECKQRDSPIEVFLRTAVMLGLLVTALLFVASAIFALVEDVRNGRLADAVANWLNATLLVFIVLELVQTIRRQINAHDRLSRDLVRNFLVIGILSSIRHLLAVGARMALATGGAATAASGGQLTPELQELAVSAGIVLVLVGCWWVARDQPADRRTLRT